MIGGTAVGGEIGAVGNGKIVPKLVGTDCGWGWWSGIPVTSRIVTGGWGYGSGVVAHVKSPNVCGELGVHAR